MRAILTFRRLAIERGVTPVAEPTGPLHRVPADEFLPGGPLENGQLPERRRGRPLEILVHRNRWTRGRSFREPILGPLGRVPRAFLATGMLAADANLFGAERDVASMACSADPDAYDLFHPLGISARGGCPLARFEPEPILDEHGPSFLFLNRIAGSSSLGQSVVGVFECRLGVLDRLLQSSRDRGAGRSIAFGRRCYHTGNARAAISQR